LCSQNIITKFVLFFISYSLWPSCAIDLNCDLIHHVESCSCVVHLLLFLVPLSISPNFYEHHLKSQIPSFSGFVYFLLHLIKDFESYLRSWNFKLFSMMFGAMLHLSTSGIFNMVSKQLQNVSTQKKMEVNEFKWVSKQWILFIKSPPIQEDFQ